MVGGLRVRGNTRCGDVRSRIARRTGNFLVQAASRVSPLSNAPPICP